MNVLPRDKKALVLRCLFEGNSIRSTARIADVARGTVTKLLIDGGEVAAEYQARVMCDLPCRRLEVDEIWAFVYAKEKNVPRAKRAPPEAGDVWTWAAICAETKLVPVWRVGDRSGATAKDLMDDLRPRLANRVQLTTDGLKAYLEAVEGAFGSDVDYAQLVKLYGKPPGEDVGADSRYSPPVCTGLRKTVIEGDPDPAHISTSYVERQNLTMRMSMRRFTRLTNAFSKKIKNHAHAVALHFMYYNFCRIHQTLSVTPAMEAGLTDRLWEVRDIVDMVEDVAPRPKRPTTYKKRSP